MEHPTGTPTPTPCLAIRLPDGSDRVLYRPLSHQLAYHTSDHVPNVLLSGGRGGGKSYAGRRDAEMRCLAIPGFRVLILRRTMPELRNTHLVYIEKELIALGGGDPKQAPGYYHKTDTTAYFHNGSFIKFGHCEDSKVIETYLSAEYDLIFFDELASFTLDQFLQISSSARVPSGCGRIALVRGATNPIGPGAGWIKAWFVDKTVDLAEHQDYDPAAFLYIHSTFRDNPHLATDYEKRLGSQSGHIRRAWLDGEWVSEGSYFEDFQPMREGHEWHCRQTFPPLTATNGLPAPLIYRAIDWGWYPDPAVCLWIAVYANSRAVVFKERTWTKTTAADVAAEIRRESEGMRVVETFCDPTMFSNSAATGSSIGDIFEQNKIALTPSKNDRSAAGFAIHEWLGTVLDDQKPKLQLYAPGCPNLVKTFPEQAIDRSNPARIADGNDHYVITLAYFAMTTPAIPRNAVDRSVPIWMQKKADRFVLGRESVKSR